MNITYESQYMGLPIMACEEKEYGCREDILMRMHTLIHRQIQDKGRAFVVRFDLRFPSGTSHAYDNTSITFFMSKFIKHFKRKGLNPYYLWVAENTEYVGNHHYHVMVICDGNRVQNPYGLLTTAERHWGQTLGVLGQGLVNHCTSYSDGTPGVNSYRIDKWRDNYQENLEACFARCSYLAKAQTKGHAPRYVREFGSSRLR